MISGFMGCIFFAPAPPQSGQSWVFRCELFLNTQV